MKSGMKNERRAKGADEQSMATKMSERARLDRRTELLAAAREVLAEKGLEAARVSEIVARAGVAQGTFYLYFPSKFSVVPALNEEMNAAIQAAIAHAFKQTKSLGETIDLAVAASFREMERHRDILGILHARTGIAENREDCRKPDQMLSNFLADLIRQAQAEGQIAASVNPQISAQLIRGLIEHAGHTCFVMNAEEPTDTFIAEVARFIRDALGVVPAT